MREMRLGGVIEQHVEVLCGRSDAYGGVVGDALEDV
jgi:hypothetical protein